MRSTRWGRKAETGMSKEGLATSELRVLAKAEAFRAVIAPLGIFQRLTRNFLLEVLQLVSAPRELWGTVAQFVTF